MTNKDWDNWGDNIRSIVQHAVDSQNFNKLNETISNSISHAAKNVEKSMKNVGIKAESKAMTSTIRPALFGKTSSTRAGGLALSIIGAILAGSMGLSMLILLIISLVFGKFTWGLHIAIGIMIPFFIGCIGSICMTIKGTAMLRRVKRFKNYIEILHNKTYCQISELAASINKSQSYVRKDLQSMIDHHWFLEGHLDQQGTCLMVSNESYQQYQQACQNAKVQQLEEQRKQEQQGNLPSEVHEIIIKGEDYIKQIRTCNDAIPGFEISEKISYMEMIIQRIFQRLEQHPESAPELRKLMDYYLPTTIKLLTAYAQLDAQPIQGLNIVSSKKEIEETLDTLNLAFEKLLDDLFKDTAWDVSSDISVLQTILAQEGLTANDFRKEE
ncbi:MAG: 5-bromo-4-chloroindolyl phosphate hydrolysis family protein [Lachnospiraceae bacterium]